MNDALQLIIARSPEAASWAMDCMRAIRAKSPMTAMRYMNAVNVALNDPQAKFTADERELLASYLSADGEKIKARSIRLSDTDWALALEIGGGDATAGIRKALNEYNAGT